MLNQVILVGRVNSEFQTKKYDNGKDATIVNLAVPRNYKNENGVYETDFINIVLWKGIASNVKEYCKKGDIIGIRGRIQTSTDEYGVSATEVVAEKVSFLSTRHDNEPDKRIENGVDTTDEI